MISSVIWIKWTPDRVLKWHLWWLFYQLTKKSVTCPCCGGKMPVGEDVDNDPNLSSCVASWRLSPSSLKGNQMYQNKSVKFWCLRYIWNGSELIHCSISTRFNLLNVQMIFIYIYMRVGLDDPCSSQLEIFYDSMVHIFCYMLPSISDFNETRCSIVLLTGMLF